MTRMIRLSAARVKKLEDLKRPPVGKRRLAITDRAYNLVAIWESGDVQVVIEAIGRSAALEAGATVACMLCQFEHDPDKDYGLRQRAILMTALLDEAVR